MGIKLIKKESAQPKGHWVVYLRGEEWCTRNTEKEAQAVVNSYDGEGDCWYEFQADESVHSASDGQRTKKTAWTYLVELETLEGAESRQEATEKILKALGYNPGTEGRWYDKDGEEIGIIDTLDNTEWDFAVKTCGQLQESNEGTSNPRWCVEFGDIYSNVEKEYYDTEEDAKARYDELAERDDIEWVEDPVMEAAEEKTVSYDDYAESVKSILMGREFEYGPETANQFVVDDYKDIVRKNFDAGKGAFTAAADIDDAYMGKE